MKNTSGSKYKSSLGEGVCYYFSLFAHMGDFTSLATWGAWPSPHHPILEPSFVTRTLDAVRFRWCTILLGLQESLHVGK